MEKYKFRAFRAIDDIGACQLYFKGHINVLSIFGVTQVTSAKDDWMFNPGAYVITAESYSGDLVGGIRIHLVGGSQPLPIEGAIGDMDPKIYAMVKEKGRTGAGELCGLWNSREVAGKGISVLLTRAGIAIATQIKALTVFGICADFTLPMFKDVGYVVETSLGNKGTFYYPKEDFNANALIMDAINLVSANSFDRELIFDLRKNLKQTRIEKGAKITLEIAYDLFIPERALLLK